MSNLLETLGNIPLDEYTLVTQRLSQGGLFVAGVHPQESMMQPAGDLVLWATGTRVFNSGSEDKWQSQATPFFDYGVSTSLDITHLCLWVTKRDYLIERSEGRLRWLSDEAGEMTGNLGVIQRQEIMLQKRESESTNLYYIAWLALVEMVS